MLRQLALVICVCLPLGWHYEARAQVDQTPELFGENGTCGPAEPVFNTPTSICMTSGVGIFVADTNNNRIIRCDITGSPVNFWGSLGVGNGEFDSPRGIAWMPSLGILYVADKNNNRIQYFGVDGLFLGKWGSPGSGNGQFSAPRDVAVSTDSLFVLDTGNNRIQVFTAQGQFVRSWGSAGSGPGQFNFPLGITVGQHVYISDTGNSRIQKFTRTGAYVAEWGAPNPWGIHLTSYGDLWVTDKDNHQIASYTTAGALNWVAGTGGGGGGQFSVPSDVTGDPNFGRLWICDSGNNRVQEWQPTGTYYGMWGQLGFADDKLRSPSDIAVDNAGNAYVADTGNHRVKKYSPSGSPIGLFGGYGSAPGRFRDPSGVGLDAAGNLYVADTNNNRIQVFAPDGTFLRQWGSYGSGSGQFVSPSDVAVDRSGTVHVADQGNSRIVRCTSVGGVLSSWSLFPVSRIDVDDSGDVFVPVYFRVERHANTGELLQTYPDIGFVNNVATDRAGYLYVSDSEARVTKLLKSGTVLSSWTIGAVATIDTDDSGILHAVTNTCKIQRYRYVNTLGIYTDATASQRNLCAPQLAVTQVRLVATLGGPTAAGLTRADFRIAVTNPSGYSFVYTPPGGAFSSGNLFDLTPGNPSDPSGGSVIFSACQPGTLPRAEGDKVDFGTINVLNAGGGTTELLVQRIIPPGSGSACPKFYQCDSPFLTQSCMSSTDGTDIVFRALLNGPACSLAPPAPFRAESLFVDLHEGGNDGVAGPVQTAQPLDSRSNYLVTVQGTASLWPSSAWGADPIVICGAPEQQPKFASGGVSNSWVGVDAEILFAVPLPPGGNCSDLPSQGYARQHGRFKIDPGSGFAALAAMGGDPLDPSPDHLYKYLVQGQDQPIRFAWFDDSTDDNYGKLRVIVSQTTTTEMTEFPPVANRLLLLPGSPNPFNPSTTIRYEVPTAETVAVVVYDIRGRVVRRLVNAHQGPGMQAVTWDGTSDAGVLVGSGVYYVKVATSTDEATTKVALIK